MNTPTIANTGTQRAPEIAALVEDARREGVFFTRDPANPNGVQIRCQRDATEEGKRLAAVLRDRRDEVNVFFAAHRPAWPEPPDDGYGPRLDPDEPDAAIFSIRLESLLAEDAIATTIEEAVSHAQERIAEIVEQAVAARRAARRKPARAPIQNDRMTY